MRVVKDDPRGADCGGGVPAPRGRELSIAVVSRNLANLRLVRDACITASGNLALEFLISWNGREDPKFVSDLFAPHEVRVEPIVPYHFSSNCNALGRMARTPYIAFLNDDVILSPDALELSIAELGDPTVGVVGINLRYDSGKVQHAGIFFSSEGKPYHRYKHLLSADDPIALETEDVPCVTGAFMMFRTEEFNQIRFDENFGVCGEDIDLCLRVRSVLQKRVRYVGRAQGIHREGVTRKETGEAGTPPPDMAKIVRSYFASRGHRPDM